MKRMNQSALMVAFSLLAFLPLVVLGQNASLDERKIEKANLLPKSGNTPGMIVKGAYHRGYDATYSHTEAIAVTPGTEFIISQGVDYQGGEFDANMNFLRDIRMPHDGKNVSYVASPGVAFVRLNINKADQGKYLVRAADVRADSGPAKKQPANGASSSFSPWAGKKIAWYGTSIPAGYPKQPERALWSYADRSAAALGAGIRNFCVPNGVIRETRNDGTALTGGRDSLSFTRLSSPINYKNSLLALIGTAEEPDLFVFDYGVNDNDEDSTDLAGFDPLDPYNSGKVPGKVSIASRDKKTFIGAQNWVIDQLLAVKPTARIALVTHFSKDSVKKSRQWEKLVQAQEALGEYWGIPVCKVYAKTGWINRDGNNTITVFNPDGIHPASARTPVSVEILTVILTDFLMGVR